MTISVTSDDENGGDSKPRGETYGLASANDTGPVTIITEDPSCAAWGPINDTFADIQKKGWNKRDPAIPASRWSPEQQASYEEVRQGAQNAADQTTALAKMTPSRVMRELYEQFIAYARAYSDAIPAYEPADENLARVMINSGATIYFICNAIQSQSAQARAPLVNPSPDTKKVAPLGDPWRPSRFLSHGDSVCGEWASLLRGFDASTGAWQNLDPATPATSWTSEQRAVVESVIPQMTQFADRAEELARETTNPVLQDFAFLTAQYRRAYAKALPTYSEADSWLTSASASAASTIFNACKAAGY
ncbi:hypothetical protein [Mycobacterium sp. E740]|uniref:hypothetical protein n=1 Tax=Mycobacterium sp. E740 TaxID=1834149 RepID=UPI001E4D74A8|nr:hypothetical protein [Mycobacterium sp. E740]